MKNTIITLLFKFIILSLSAQTGRPILNQVFDHDLKTVQLYALGNGTIHPGLSLNVLNLKSNDQMILEFDDLSGSYRQFHVKIQHCNLDWTPSRLMDLEYLKDYNDFIINDYEISQNTKIPYYHYGFSVPQLKISGNYVLQLYENYISNEPLASLRFLVVDNQVGILANVKMAQDPAYWKTHEQLNFELNYGNYQVRDPRNDFKVIIRQNFRSDTDKSGFKASSLNGARRTLNYTFFGNENLFQAGNEFRYADLRSNFNKGDNVSEIKQGFEDHIWLIPQASRAQRTYLESKDLNGRYIIETLDGTHPSVNGDYMHIHAAFKTRELKPTYKLCLLGGFNQYNCDEVGRMYFNEEVGMYETTLLMKQGMYDFQFGVFDENGNIDFNFLEGSFSDTKNSYEIFVYHKPPSAKSDILVGYALIEE